MLTGKKIIIVEDSRTIKLQIKMMLEKENAELVEVGTEWGLLNKIDDYGKIADLIIMDLMLNSEDGLEIIRKLKQNSPYKDIPIIVITEIADAATVLKAKALGVKSYLRKPIRKAELIDRISSILETLPDKK